MAVEISPVHRQSLPTVRRVEDNPVPLAGKIGQPDYSMLVREAQNKSYSPVPTFHPEERPLEPIEPEPYKLTAIAWGEYIIKRDAARAYEAEHSLRGVPFS